ncbi:MAG: hypothetical protein DMG39_04035 [Acidobacteria bacterium]|nr:MAG: hypothetical protein DMG39_04035 [Acidobacteriota bacterium]
MRQSFVFFAQQFLQHFACALQLPGPHQRLGIRHEKRRVVLRGCKRLENRDRSHCISALQNRLRIEQRHTPLLWRQLLRAAK